MRSRRIHAGVSIPCKISILTVFWHRKRFLQTIVFHLYFDPLYSAVSAQQLNELSYLLCCVPAFSSKTFVLWCRLTFSLCVCQFSCLSQCIRLSGKKESKATCWVRR